MANGQKAGSVDRFSVLQLGARVVTRNVTSRGRLTITTYLAILRNKWSHS